MNLKTILFSSLIGLAFTSYADDGSQTMIRLMKGLRKDSLASGIECANNLKAFESRDYFNSTIAHEAYLSATENLMDKWNSVEAGSIAARMHNVIRQLENYHCSGLPNTPPQPPQPPNKLNFSCGGCVFPGTQTCTSNVQGKEISKFNLRCELDMTQFKCSAVKEVGTIGCFSSAVCYKFGYDVSYAGTTIEQIVNNGYNYEKSAKAIAEGLKRFDPRCPKNP